MGSFSKTRLSQFGANTLVSFPRLNALRRDFCVCQVDNKIKSEGKQPCSEVSFIYHWQFWWILQTLKADCGKWMMLTKMFISKTCRCLWQTSCRILPSTLIFLIVLIRRLPPTLQQPLRLTGPWTTKVHHAINYANILNPQEAVGSPNKMACITFYLLYMHTSYALCQILGCLIPPPPFDSRIFNFVKKYNTWKKLTNTDSTPPSPHTHTPRTHACHPSLI